MKTEELKAVLEKHKLWLEGHADGERADLIGANLWNADLSGADLSGANLIDTKLWDCTGNRTEIKSVSIFEQYTVVYTSDRLQIGCENHPIEDWWTFSDEQIIEMGGKTALKFWRENKDLIRTIIEKQPATPTGHSDD